MSKQRRKINGYIHIYVPDHPAAFDGGYVAEHRLVMEEYLSQIIPQGYCIHHIDENIENNIRDNLLLIKGMSDHKKLHQFKKNGDTLKEQNLLFELLNKQEKIRQEKINLKELYSTYQKNNEEIFLDIVDLPEYAEIVVCSWRERQDVLKRLREKYNEQNIALAVRESIIPYLNLKKHKNFMIRLCWLLGECKDNNSIKFIFDFLYINYGKKKKKTNSKKLAIESLKAIYKIARVDRGYQLRKKDYSLLIKIFVWKSRDAVMMGLMIVNVLDVSPDVKLGIYRELDKNQLYFRSKGEFNRLVSESNNLLDSEIDKI